MTPNEISTLIAETLQRQLDLPFRLAVFDKFKLWRSTLIKNTIQKQPNMKNMFVQTIFVKTAPYSSKGCADGPNCIDGARTVIPIPLAVRVGNSPYDYVGGVQGDNSYSYGAPSASRYIRQGKYSGTNTFWYMSNQYIVVSNPIVTDVRIDDVFDDPLEAKRLSCEAQNVSCDLWNEPYPATTQDIIQQAIEYVIQSYTQINVKPEDHESEIGDKS
jgi:hypothetical protein